MNLDLIKQIDFDATTNITNAAIADPTINLAWLFEKEFAKLVVKECVESVLMVCACTDHKEFSCDAANEVVREIKRKFGLL